MGNCCDLKGARAIDNADAPINVRPISFDSESFQFDAVEVKPTQTKEYSVCFGTVSVRSGSSLMDISDGRESLVIEEISSRGLQACDDPPCESVF